MKQIILVIVFFMAATSASLAQDYIIDKDNEKVLSVVKQRLKDEFKFSITQTDSVVFTQQQFQIQTKEIFENLIMTEKDQKDFVKEKHQLYRSRMRRFVAEDKLDLVEEFYKKNIKELRIQYPG
jgi:hypothetical protein